MCYRWASCEDIGINMSLVQFVKIVREIILMEISLSSAPKGPIGIIGSDNSLVPFKIKLWYYMVSTSYNESVLIKIFIKILSLVYSFIRLYLSCLLDANL